MAEICLVCGNRISSKKCGCGFDISKYYDSYRTLGKISAQVVSAYKKRKEYEKKLIDKAVDSAIADYDKKIKAQQASASAGSNNTANASHNSAKETNSTSNQRKSVDAGSSDYKNGIIFYMGTGVKKDYVKAYNLFCSAADKGNAEAMNCLGDMYYFGDGVVRNMDTAKEWYMKASRLGNELAKKNLEKRFGIKSQTTSKTATNDKTTTESASKQAQQTTSSTFRKASNEINERNARDERVQQGLKYCVGDGCYKSYSMAAKLFETASNQGNSLAMVYLGDMYYFGDGVAQNVDTAQTLYGRAAALGDELGAYNLEKRMGRGIEKRDGRTYLKKLVSNDQTIKPDYIEESSVKEGYRYYSIAKYDTSKNKETYAKQALEIFMRHAKIGNTEAMNYLGEMYYFGDCVVKNEETAKSWYKKSAADGNYMAKRRLEQWFGIPTMAKTSASSNQSRGDNATNINNQKTQTEQEAKAEYYLKEGKEIFLSPVPIEFRHNRNEYYKPAFNNFKKAADYNNAQAMFYLGEMYYFGDGVSKNLEESKKWYKKASDLGNVDAKQNLKKRFGISL